MSKWYENSGPEKDVASSTRVRLARNVEGFAFEDKLSEDNARKVVHILSDALVSYGGLKLTDMADISPVMAAAMAEQHIVSPEFAASDRIKGLVTNEDNSISVMLNEEDHMRIQTLAPGFDLRHTFETANKVDDAVDSKVKYAFDEELGYLTHCPTNLGTAMRASVMLHLPGLTVTGALQKVLNAVTKLSITVRGIYGEGSEAEGAFYQVSNQVTMGLSEEETIEKLSTIVEQIIEHERSAREAVLKQGGDQVLDRIFRSYGIIKNARLMTTNEFMQRISDVRLGAALGLIKDIPLPEIDSLIVQVQPSAIMLQAGGGNLTPIERDKLRADIIRKTL